MLLAPTTRALHPCGPQRAARSRVQIRWRAVAVLGWRVPGLIQSEAPYLILMFAADWDGYTRISTA